MHESVIELQKAVANFDTNTISSALRPVIDKVIEQARKVLAILAKPHKRIDMHSLLQEFLANFPKL